MRSGPHLGPRRRLEAEHELAHALHNPPGNPISYPLADGVRHVGGDNGVTGGHVTVTGGRLYVGA